MEDKVQKDIHRAFKEYQDFMRNPKNKYNCHECPENRKLGILFPERLPCGQNNCCVVCHTKSQEGEG